MGPQDPNLKQERLLASSFVHSFTPSFGGYFLSAYSMPGTMKCRRENKRPGPPQWSSWPSEGGRDYPGNQVVTISNGDEYCQCANETGDWPTGRGGRGEAGGEEGGTAWEVSTA